MTLVVGAVAAVVTWVIVWGVRRYSERGALLDIPNERSSHTHPTPRGGGLGIVLVTIVGALIWVLFHADFLPVVLAYAMGAAGIAAISWIDDVKGLSNRVRFGTHIVGALLVVMVGGWIDQITLPVVGTIHLGWIGLPLTLFWIVGFTNAYNFMDGIDGIAGTQAVVAGVGWTIVGNLLQNPLIVMLGVLLAASSGGFLLHNWAPAKIFMGDVGSAFLGFTFAVLTVLGTQTTPTAALIGVLIVWPFIFDTAYTMFRRWRKGENIFTAHRSHLYQRLVIAGQSHAKVTLLYGLLSTAGLLLVLSTTVQFWACGVVGFAAVLLWRYVQIQEQALPS